MFQMECRVGKWFGLPDISVKEAKERVKTAIKNSGYEMLSKRIIINLAPADTKKRPIVNKRRREIYKIISTILTIIFSFLALLIKDNFISNCLIFSIILQNCMISPSIYKLFNLPYNNYIMFLKEHPDFIQ